MIGRLNHVAIVVPCLKTAVNQYKNDLGASVSNKMELKDHGVTTVFVKLPNTNIELLEPLGKNSPISNFLKKNKIGGIHHLCYEVDDINHALEKLCKKKYNVLGKGIPHPGAHGKDVFFLHPKDFNGTLLELEQK